MEKQNEQIKKFQQMDVEEITIGNTTYVVKSNAKSVPKQFVMKTVEKLLFDALKQKS